MKQALLSLLIFGLAGCTAASKVPGGGNGLPPVIAPVVSANDEPPMFVEPDGGFRPLVAPGTPTVVVPMVQFNGLAN